MNAKKKTPIVLVCLNESHFIEIAQVSIDKPAIVIKLIDRKSNKNWLKNHLMKTRH